MVYRIIVPNILFLGLVIFLLVFLYVCLKKSTKIPYLILSAILAWLLITGVLSINGFFTNFDTLPPRILFVISPMILLLIYVSFSLKVVPLLRHIPQTWLIHVHAFRIVMEIILWLLAEKHVIPELMTWNGRNFDIIAGVSAPFIAYFCFTTQCWPKNVALYWNILGLLLLVNVFGHGLLSAPLPFQVIFPDPPNIFVATFPYTWLPAFVVPCAFLFHILSIRKLTTKNDMLG
jgi:hypothetical protein